MSNELNFYQEIEEDLKKYLMEDCMFLENKDINEENEVKKEPEDVSKEELKQFAKDFGSIAKKKAVVIKGKALKLMDKIKNQKITDQSLIALPSELHTLTKATVGIGACTVLLGNPLIGIIGYITSTYLTKGVTRNRRIDLVAKYNGEIKVVNAKIEELNALPELNEEQKQQKYTLIKIKEKYKMDLAKISAQLS